MVGIFQGLAVYSAVFYALKRPNLLLSWATLSLVGMTAAFMAGVGRGLLGVAWAYVIMSPILWGVPHFIASRLIGLRFRHLGEAIASPVVAATVMGLFVDRLAAKGGCRFAHNWANLLIAVALGAIIYTIVLVLIAQTSSRGRHDLVGWFMGRYLETEGSLR